MNIPTTVTVLQHAIYSTIAYFSLFEFAPTLVDIQRWLIKNTLHTSPSLSEIEQAIASDSRIISSAGVYYILSDSEKNLPSKRKQKYNFTEEKWKRAKRFLPWLAIMPGVQAIWFGNSVAWCNAREQSDIDLVIISKPGNIWTARFFTTTLMKLLRQRPHEQEHAKALCLSFYVDADHLNIETYKVHEQDIHYSFWVTQMYPLYDSKTENGTFEDYKKENQWVENEFVFSPWLQPIMKRTIQLRPYQRILQKIFSAASFFESTLRRVQLRIMPKKLTGAAATGSTVVLSDTILKLHTNDNRLDIQNRWEALLQ